MQVSGFQHAAANLVKLDALEQGLEIALAEAVVALALDDLEEDGADGVFGEDLEQPAAVFGRRAVDQDLQALQFADRLAMAGQARVDAFVIGIRRRHEFGAAAASMSSTVR